MVIEEEWFDDTDLIDGETFLMALTKLAKYRFNKESNFPGDKKRRIWEIAINNV